MRPTILQKLCVRKEWVNFHLINDRFDLGKLKQVVEMFNFKIGYPNGTSLASSVELFHSLPDGLTIFRKTFLDDILK